MTQATPPPPKEKLLKVQNVNVMLTTRPVLFLSVNSDADINNSDLKQQQEKANVSLGIGIHFLTLTQSSCSRWIFFSSKNALQSKWFLIHTVLIP